MELVIQETPKYIDNRDDQRAFNLALNANFQNIKEKLLPSDKYFTVAAAATWRKVWKGQKFKVPDTIKVHHANWTVGLKNKIKLLDYVRKQKCKK